MSPNLFSDPSSTDKIAELKYGTFETSFNSAASRYQKHLISRSVIESQKAQRTGFLTHFQLPSPLCTQVSIQTLQEQFYIAKSFFRKLNVWPVTTCSYCDTILLLKEFADKTSSILCCQILQFLSVSLRSQKTKGLIISEDYKFILEKSSSIILLYFHESKVIISAGQIY